MRNATLVAALILSVHGTCIAEGSHTVNGRIFDAATGAPRSGIRVHIVPAELGPHDPIDPAVSDSDGRFSFRGVPTGSYAFQAWVDGELIRSEELLDGTSVGVRFGDTPGDMSVNFPVPIPAMVSGVIKDEFGDPANSVTVTAMRYWWNDGHIHRGVSKQTSSDDLGRYRLPNLPPGLYTICALKSAPDPIGRGPDGDGVLAPEPSPIVDFSSPTPARVYRPSCSNAKGTSPLRLDWAQTAEVNLSLAGGPLLTISGRVTNATDGVVLLEAEESAVGTPAGQVKRDGTFRLLAPAPGLYRLGLVGRGSGHADQLGDEKVAVTDTPVSGVELTLQPGVEIMVSIQGPGPVSPDSLTLSLRATGPIPDSYYAIEQQGALHFSGIRPGRYWVQTRTNLPYCIESILLNGQPVLHGTVTLQAAESSRMEVTLSTQCASIEGHVLTNGTGHFPVMWMLMSGTPQTPGDLYKIEPDLDDEFAVAELPPGRYLIWAWPQDLAYPGPASLADIAPFATVVDLTKGQHVNVQVRVVDLKGPLK